MNPSVLSSAAADAKKRRLERIHKLRAKRARRSSAESIQQLSLGMNIFLLRYSCRC